MQCSQQAPLMPCWAALIKASCGSELQIKITYPCFSFQMIHVSIPCAVAATASL
jgi:hypothetical protein